MKSQLLAVTLIASVLVAALGALSIAEDEAEGYAVTCPVSGKEIDKEVKVDYKDGQVFFCCPGCPGPFKRDTAKFAAFANAQLVATGQYQAKACPITGKKINPETAVVVAGVKVAFCCNDCKGKVEKAEGPAKIELVFNDKAFEKGFEKPASE